MMKLSLRILACSAVPTCKIWSISISRSVPSLRQTYVSELANCRLPRRKKENYWFDNFPFVLHTRRKITILQSEITTERWLGVMTKKTIRRTRYKQRGIRLWDELLDRIREQDSPLQSIRVIIGIRSVWDELLVLWTVPVSETLLLSRGIFVSWARKQRLLTFRGLV